MQRCAYRVLAAMSLVVVLGGCTSDGRRMLPSGASTTPGSGSSTTLSARSPRSTSEGESAPGPERVFRVDVVSARLTVLAVSRIPAGSGGSRLEATSDNGRTFRSMGPSVPRDFAPDDVFFLDQRHGWVTMVDVAGRELVLRTVNGGRSWQRLQAPFPGPAGGSTDTVDFVSPTAGWLVSLDPAGPVETLYRTVDAGAHWRPVSTLRSGRLPQLGLVRFSAASAVGYEGGDYFTRSSLYVTADGGASWAASDVPPQAGRAFGLPDLFGRNLIEAVSDCRHGRTSLSVYAGARSLGPWQRASVLERAGATRTCAQRVTAQFVTPKMGWAVATSTNHVATYVTSDTGVRWTRRQPLPVAPTGQPFIQAANSHVAWLIAPDVDGKTTAVYVTTDTAAHWRRVDLLAVR